MIHKQYTLYRVDPQKDTVCLIPLLFVVYSTRLLFYCNIVKNGGPLVSSDQNFIDFIVEQTENAGIITYRKMFGEYALYCEGKVVALVCDNQLFVKPTVGGRTFIGNVVEAPAYPGAKPSFLIEDKIEDREWISTLIRITFDELPMPKPKTKKKKQGKTFL
jgi:TfoX/Sxy family transcriptional regulator of competence genes